MELERKLPSNVQAEQILLGAILINPELIHKISDFLHPTHFFEHLHKKIYAAILSLDQKGQLVSPVTVKLMLEKEEVSLFHDAGGARYLHELTLLAMVVINSKDYAHVIHELALKRQLIKIGEEMVNDAYDPSPIESVAEQIEFAQDCLYDLNSNRLKDKNYVLIQDSLETSMQAIAEAMSKKEHITGIPTGLTDLDNKLCGFQNSNLVIIAARPAMGKTAFAINFALNACKALHAQGKGVALFSLEMSADEITTRILARETKINSSFLRSGKNLGEEGYNRLRNASSALRNVQFIIDDTPALSIAALRTRAKELKRKHNLGIIFVDYLQLLHTSRKGDNRVMEISDITQGLKAIAKELNIPVIALSQLSRAVEQREHKRPILSDLRDSGTIEQDADIVMFLYREEYYLKNAQPTPQSSKYAEWQEKMAAFTNVAEILIAKHRNGPFGEVHLNYATEFSHIQDLSSEKKAEVRKYSGRN